MLRSSLTASVLTATLFASCNFSPSPPSESPDANVGESFSGVLEVNRDVDLLLVIDNSNSMLEEQEQLIASFPSLATRLAALIGGRPDLHIGVISTDAGALESVPTCSAKGDNGQLLMKPECGASDAFLASGYDDEGKASNNFPGALEDAFDCAALLGVTGCGFESPLESAMLALDPVANRNPGFLRSEALLVVIFLTDEDDCSATDRETVFGMDSLNLNFRCFPNGIICDPDDPESIGDKSSCVPRVPGPMFDLDQVAGFFKDLKAKGRFAASAIYGVPAEDGAGFAATVVDNGGEPLLGSTCASATGVATPAIRLRTFIDLFPGSTESSICGLAYDLDPLAAQITSALTVACLPDGAALGAPTCTVMRTSPAGAEQIINPCASSDEVRCYEAVASESSVCDAGPAFVYRPGLDDEPGSTVVFDCAN